MIIRFKRLMPVFRQIYDGKATMSQDTIIIDVHPLIIRASVSLKVIHSLDQLKIRLSDSLPTKNPS